MNSSGIKRGLATTAVTALAVTGIPFIATSANAATSDEIVVGYVGPTRNGGDTGGVVVLKTKNISEAEAEGTDDAAARLQLIGTNNTSPANNANQTVAIVGTPVWIESGTTNDSNKSDGYDEVVLRVSATTPEAGQTAQYNVFLDDDVTTTNNNTVQASEARATVSQVTSGPVTQVEVSPTGQTAPQNTASSPYTVTLKDSAGRTTQLMDSEDVDVDPSTDLAINALAPNTTFSATKVEAARGTFQFTAQSSEKALHNIAITGPNSSAASATLDVVSAASIAHTELDIVTGADDWKGFGGGGGYGTTQVRVDQTSVKLDIKGAAADAGGVVVVKVTSSNVTFDGKGEKTFTTTLDANAVGSIVITPDAGTIAEGDSFAIAGSGITETINFVRSSLASSDIVPSATAYVSAFGGSVDVTAKVVDQFGLPLTSGLVTVQRTGGANAETTESARKAVDANGTVTFTLTDTKANANNRVADALTFRYYEDQFDNTAGPTDSTARIEYSATGQGADFNLLLDGTNPTGTAYDPASVTTQPLTSAVEEDAVSGDDIVLGINGGTAGAPVTVSVDNGALILKNGEDTLAKGSATDTGIIGADGFQIVGTKAGLTTVTVTSAGVTKTAQFTVKQLADPAATARNIAVSGPEAADSGDQVTFTAVITDAFGNPIPGFKVSNLNIQVSGPGAFQDSDAQTNAAGQINLNVRLDDDADGPLTIRVTPTSTGDQFGAAANRLTAAATTDNAPGLTASSNIATATIADVTNLEALRQAVADAQEKVDAAEADLTAANRDLRVATAELEVAQDRVEAAKDRKQKARKALRKAIRKGKGIKAARANFREAKADLREARGEKKIAKVKVSAAQEIVDSAQAALEAAQAELEAAQQALEDAEND